MADLAKTETNAAVRRRGSTNRDFTLPGRRQTDAPGLEVNARVQRTGQSEAQLLMDVLRLGENAADNVGRLVAANGERQAARDAAAGALAGASGTADPEQLRRSRAYADSFYTEGARRAGMELDERVTAAVISRLDNTDDPATLEDITAIIDQEFAAIGLDEQGRPRDFGSPGAARALATQMVQTRARLIPVAAERILTQNRTQLAENVAANVIREGIPLVADRTRVPAAGEVQAIDPGASSLAPDAAAAPAGDAQATPAATPRPRPAYRTAAEVTALVREIAPGAIITQTSRSRSSTLGQANPTSYHLSGRAIDMAPVPGMTFEQMRSQLQARGLNIVEAIDEVAHPSRHSTGPHWHFAWGDPQEGTARPTVDVAVAPRPVPVQVQAYDFEAVIDRMPGVPRGEAKRLLMPALVVSAERAQNGNILRGLALSTRADGTPSFNPTEILQLNAEARRIDGQAREEARRIETERHEANQDRFLTVFIDGGSPSRESIREAARNNDISEEFAYSLINHLDAEERQAAAEARQAAREARMDAENAMEMELGSIIEARRSGDIDGATAEADRRLFSSGALGTGRAAAARLRRLRSAASEGGRVRLQSEDGALYARRLSDHFGIARTGNGSLLVRRGGTYDPEIGAAAQARYRALVQGGQTPAEAYSDVIQTYGPRTNNNRDTLAARRRELQSRR